MSDWKEPCCPMCLVTAESAGPVLDWLFGASTGIRIYQARKDMYMCERHKRVFESYMKAIDVGVLLADEEVDTIKKALS